MFSKSQEFVGHPCSDLDLTTCYFLTGKYGNADLKKIKSSVLTTGDEDSGMTNIVFKNRTRVYFDRGRRDFDHHGENNEETSASKVAKALEIHEKPSIRILLGLVRRADLQGESLPFNINDFVKAMQRRVDLTDKERRAIGIRAIGASVEFHDQNLERENSWGKAVITEFLSGKEVPPKFEQYLERLENPRFERPFDLIEIMGGEKFQHDKETAETFGKELLELIYQDSLMYFRAQDVVKEAKHISVRGKLIIAGITNNPKFNVAARSIGAIVIVQKSSTGIQIFFDSNKVDDRLTDSIVSMLRLEECLIQKRKIPKTDLRRTEGVEGIPEWYYAKFPSIGKKPPGRLILNGSLTAPDVPTSKIKLEDIVYIIISAVKFHPRFNWERWRQERLHYHQGLSK